MHNLYIITIIALVAIVLIFTYGVISMKRMDNITCIALKTGEIPRLEQNTKADFKNQTFCAEIAIDKDTKETKDTKENIKKDKKN